MRLSPQHVLGAVTIGLLALTGCSSDDPTDDAAAEQTTAAEQTSPADGGDEPSDEPAEEPSDTATLPGGGAFSESCAEVEQALTDAQEAITEAVSDPAAAQEVLTQVAEDLRAAADGAEPDIQAAVEDLAGAYEGFAEALQSGEIPQIEDLTDAATSLAEACTP